MEKDKSKPLTSEWKMAWRLVFSFLTGSSRHPAGAGRTDLPVTPPTVAPARTPIKETDDLSVVVEEVRREYDGHHSRLKSARERAQLVEGLAITLLGILVIAIRDLHHYSSVKLAAGIVLYALSFLLLGFGVLSSLAVLFVRIAYDAPTTMEWEDWAPWFEKNVIDEYRSSMPSILKVADDRITVLRVSMYCVTVGGVVLAGALIVASV